MSTKSGFAAGKEPHQGGNGVRHVQAAVEGSLKRLRTDVIDLYWVHVWDGLTPAAELLQTFSALKQAGKLRYWGLSNSPAWYVAEVATLARLHGQAAPIGLQYFYSLVERGVESEHVPLGRAFGMGLVPWSPLAYGLLTGKYDRATIEAGPARRGGVPNEGGPANVAATASSSAGVMSGRTPNHASNASRAWLSNSPRPLIQPEHAGAQLEHAAQMSAYIMAAGAARGAIVYLSRLEIVWVSSTKADPVLR